MKVEIVSLVDLKKTKNEREAEEKLKELMSEANQDKALRIVLEKPETPRKINRIFRKAAQTMGREITARTRGDSVIIKLKEKEE